MGKIRKRGEDTPRRHKRHAERPEDAEADIVAPAVLDWEHDVDEIAQAGLDIERTASEAERREIAGVLDLLAVDRLEVAYRLRPRAGGLFSLEGRLKADIRQTCVVSLEEMTTHIDEPLSAEFWPAERMPMRAAPVLIDDAEGEEPLAIRDGRIETGRLVFDVLALAIDPHPRKSEASFEWKEEDGGAGKADPPAKPNPFAALAKLQKRDD